MAYMQSWLLLFLGVKRKRRHFPPLTSFVPQIGRSTIFVHGPIIWHGSIVTTIVRTFDYTSSYENNNSVPRIFQRSARNSRNLFAKNAFNYRVRLFFNAIQPTVLYSHFAVTRNKLPIAASATWSNPSCWRRRVRAATQETARQSERGTTNTRIVASRVS